MSSSKEFKNYILEELSELNNIIYRPMMGEYLLYYKGVLFGGIYDDRLLIKIVHNNQKYQLKKTIPYPNAKEMYEVEDIENKELLKNIIVDTYNELKK